MPSETSYQLTLQVEVEDADREELDGQTRQLLEEINAQDVESATLYASGQAPSGTKGLEEINLGAILVQVGPSVLPLLVESVASWVGRGKGRTVKFKGEINGKQVDFEGSMADFERTMALLKSSG